MVSLTIPVYLFAPGLTIPISCLGIHTLDRFTEMPRERPIVIAGRFSRTEAAIVDARCADDGVSRASLVRGAVLKSVREWLHDGSIIPDLDLPVASDLKAESTQL